MLFFPTCERCIRVQFKIYKIKNLRRQIMSKIYETPICEVRVTIVDCLTDSTLTVGEDDIGKWGFGKEGQK